MQWDSSGINAGYDLYNSQRQQKEQAALQASAQNSAPAKRASSQEELDSLRTATRFGGSSADEAIAARMRSIPWANK